MTKPVGRFAVRLVAAVATAVAVTAGALAAASLPADAAPAAGALGTSVPVMIVLDASGSMNTRDAPGPRIDAAKTAVTDLVHALPADAQVGLTVYGTTTSSAASAKAAGCRDIHTLVPVGRGSGSALARAVRGVHARGYTPIGASLRAAAAALPAGEPASIVLVSDGLDTCTPPAPCTVAQQLKRQHRDLIVHTIGFKVDRAARTALGCIAKVTGGTYRDASDGATIGPALRSQVDAGLRPYVVSGIPVTGTTTPAAAPLLAPGQYTDTFNAGAPVTKYYTVRLAAPVTIDATTTIVPPALRGGGVTDRLKVGLRLLNPDGERCLSTEREDTPVLSGKVDPVTAVLTGRVGGEDWSTRCATRGTFTLEVTRDSASTTPTRSETIIALEPVADPVPPAASTVPAGLAPPAPTGPVTACVGGASFNTSVQLPTHTCRDSLSTGETRYYRVHLDWGQRLTYQVVIDRVAGLGHQAGYMRTAVASPLRQGLTLASTSNASRYFGGPSSITASGSTLVPVAYGNRTCDRSDIRPYANAGDYYLTVGMSYPTGAVPYSTGIRLTAHVTGTALAGPHYLPLPAPVSSPPSPPTASTGSTGGSGTYAGHTGAARDPSGLDGGGWAPLVLAGLAFLGVGAGLHLLRRHKLA